MNWGRLRVWNDDTIAPETGFPPHPHSDMEIITYVREGAITHQDSLGNKGRTEAGDVQVMSAGTGIRHSEYNLEPEPTRIFRSGSCRRGAARRRAGGRGRFREESVRGVSSRWRAALPMTRTRCRSAPTRACWVRRCARARAPNIRWAAGRHGYLVPATGAVTVNGVRLEAGDGAAIRDEPALHIRAEDDAELVLVDAA